MAWKLEPGLQLAIGIILEVRSHDQSGNERWDGWWHNQSAGQ